MEIKIDSRKIKKGDTFIALKGVNGDGHDFIEDAIKKGARKIIAEKGDYSIETILVKNTREYLINYLKESVYEQIKDLKLIGVTGTNGKTTTCFLLYEALNKLGIKAAYIGTIGFYVEDEIRNLNNTTPDILELYEMLLECKEKGITHIAMEVSSHALAYDRVGSLEFDYTLFTNLTIDHLDYHETMENYAKEKQKLFFKIKKDGKAIINNDDPYKSYFICLENNNIMYGFNESDYKIISYSITDNESKFEVKSNEKTYNFESKLIGKYNIYNLASVIAVLLEMGFVNIEEIIKNIDPPIGRMDKLRYNGNTVIIDYAHTPDAVLNIIKCAKDIAKGKLYTIVGCGGNRDKSKRPIMGDIATSYSDYVIFTSDNPRYEKADKILMDITEKLEKTNFEIIENREKAIEKGMQKLENNDILLVLGKGHENYQIINGEKIHLDDKEIVLNIIRR
jgi:UDP-N-acetylmuramyl-tripeptide synthetase